MRSNSVRQTHTQLDKQTNAKRIELKLRYLFTYLLNYYYIQIFNIDINKIIFLFQDNEKLQFISGIKVIGDDLLLLSSKLQNYFSDKVNEKEINYRIIKASVDQLTKGTKCRRSRREIYKENNDGLNDFSSDTSQEKENKPEDIKT